MLKNLFNDFKIRKTVKHSNKKDDDEGSGNCITVNRSKIKGQHLVTN